MMHPLDKLAEEWAEATPGGTPSPYDLGYASANQHCGEELSLALASLWHPFDPEDPKTWPPIHAGISAMHQVAFDDDTVGVGYLVARSGEWQTWTSSECYRARRNVKKYTELLPGPK